MGAEKYITFVRKILGTYENPHQAVQQQLAAFYQSKPVKKPCWLKSEISQKWLLLIFLQKWALYFSAGKVTDRSRGGCGPFSRG